MTPARFRWGVLWITLGLLLLLRNLDQLNDNIWIDLVMYFPVVIIAIGVEKIFTKSKLQAISYATSVFLFAAGMAIAYNAGSGGENNSYFGESSHMVEFDPSVKVIKATLDLGETDLTIRDAGSDLVFSEFDRFTAKPSIDWSLQDDEGHLCYDSRRASFLGGIVQVDEADSQDWYVEFSDRVPLDLECRGENDDIHLNLATTPVQALTIDADDATVYIKLGALEPLVKVEIEGTDSRVRLRLPEEIGLRVRGDEFRSLLTSYGLIEDGSGFVTEGIDTSSSTVELDVDDKLSSFSIDFF